jgi:MFS family permease
VTQVPLDRSYRALFAVPSLGRVLLGMQIARIAQTMVSVAIVLFTLTAYGSPALAGLVTFASLFPGLLVSPVAGALLDRHGRARLIVLDYLVALAALILIGVLALTGHLPPWLLVLIAAVSSLTGILSHTGLRSLFPIIVPSHLWERVNAVDSNGYVVATIIGPPLAAGLVAVIGGPVTLIAIGLAFGVAALVMRGAPDPRTEVATAGSLWRDAWAGVGYTWRNPTLRGLGFGVSVLNLSSGMVTIVVPLIILRELDLGEAAVGWIFAISGLTGMVSAFASGRIDTRGREWRMIVWPMLATAPVTALLLPGTGSLAFVALSMSLSGLLVGPLDIAMFTIRQRRTDPAWMGRAFAISMAFNFMGFPIGAALAGVLAAVSLDLAIVFGTVACLVGALFAAALIPRAEPDQVGLRAVERAT